MSQQVQECYMEDETCRSLNMMSDMRVELREDGKPVYERMLCAYQAQEENAKRQRVTVPASCTSGRTRIEVQFLVSGGIGGTSLQFATPWRSSAGLHLHPWRFLIQRANTQ